MENVNMNNEAQVETVAVADAKKRVKQAAVWTGVGIAVGITAWRCYKLFKKAKTVVDVVAEEPAVTEEEAPAA